MSIGEKVAVLAKTRAPAKITCLLIVAETRDRFEEAYPPMMPVDTIQAKGGIFDPRVVDDIAYRRDGLMETYSILASHELEQAGVPRDMLQEPSLQQYAKAQAQRQLFTEWLMNEYRRPTFTKHFGLCAKDFDPRAEPHERSDFSFNREIVRGIVVGAFMGPGRGDIDLTIKFLNKGLPSGQGLVTYYHIRTHLDGFISTIWKKAGCATGLSKTFQDVFAQYWVHRIAVGNAIWERLGGRDGKNGQSIITELMRLVENGDFHALYRTVEMSSGKVEPSIRAHAEIYERQARKLRKRLDNMLAA